MVKKIIVLLLIAFSSKVTAFNHLKDIKHQCYAPNGSKVDVRIASPSYFRSRHVDFGIATANFNRPEILLDISSLRSMPEVFRLHVYYHECAHHALGHVGTAYYSKQANKQDRPIREREADCWAVRTMKEHHHISQQDLDLIKPIILPMQDLWNASGKARFEHLSACLAEK